MKINKKPSNINLLAASSFPILAAQPNGVKLLVFLSLIEAPNLTKKLMTFA